MEKTWGKLFLRLFRQTGISKHCKAGAKSTGWNVGLLIHQQELTFIEFTKWQAGIMTSITYINSFHSHHDPLSRYKYHPNFAGEEMEAQTSFIHSLKVQKSV